jgi:hypothetical protein
MRRHALFALAALIAFSVPALADGMDKRSPVMQNFYGPTYSHNIFMGGEVARDSWEGYLGTVVALNRDLSKDGVLLRTMGTYGQYDYTVSNCFNCGGTPTNFDGRVWQGDVMVGYQWVRQQFDMAIYAGLDMQNHRITPAALATDNPVRGSEAGFKVVLDLESHRHTGQPLYYALEGAYSTAFDTWYAMGRIGANRNGHIIGVEGWLLGDETGNAQRLGGFLSFERQLRADLLAEFTLSAGYQFTDEDLDRICGSFFGSEGAYATLNVSFFFGDRHHRPLKP